MFYLSQLPKMHQCCEFSENTSHIFQDITLNNVPDAPTDRWTTYKAEGKKIKRYK